ncbi:MAG TPA: ABC transporter substrate-binding protein [Jatrophihabitantaceae bacterium]|jgi:osmoprotectant transport system substrate-binding protein
MKRTYLLAGSVLASVLALAACGSSGSSNKTSAPATSAPATNASTPASGASGGSGSFPAGPGSITVGSADFTESTLLADIYADAMSAKGVKVNKHLNIGERPIYMKALNDGSIDYIPEYSGSILSYLDASATAKTPTDVYSALQQKLGSNLAALQYAQAQDSDTITVTKATVQKYHLTSIADLAPVASKLTLGAPAQFKTRPDGVPALKSVYGVTFGRFTPLQAGGAITVTALKNGTIDAADIFSTDSSIAQNNFVSLTDPKSMFAAQNIVPIATKAKLTQPMVDASNAVSAKLDTKTLADLVAKASSGDPDQVAKQWLASVNLG